MYIPDDDDDVQVVEALANGRRPWPFLHGLWRDEVRGSTMCIDASEGSPQVAYCSGGEHELTCVYERWTFDGRQFFARWRWLDRPLTGYVVLRIESRDSLVGGWWYQRDVPDEQLSRLPFVPGVNPCRWVRQPRTRPWPDWATKHLELPASSNADSIIFALPPARRKPFERTSAARYRERIERWIGGRHGLSRLAARLRHHGWWLVHNLVAHPLLALAPLRPSVALHDWTSRRLNLDDAIAPSPAPRIERRLWWLLHNLVSHPTIGLFPCARSFRWLDTTARRMAVHGWI